jgi:hypothetical protein
MALSLMQKKLPSGAGLLAAIVGLNTVKAIDPSAYLLYEKGPVALKPQFNLSETFNDNVTYRSDDQKADLITTLSPGLALQVGRKDFNSLELTYFYERLLYADKTEFDANQHHIGSHLRFQKSRLTLDGRDVIDFLSSPIGGTGTSQGGAEGVTFIGERSVDRWIFSDVYRLTWDTTEKTDLYVQARHYLLDYEEGLLLYDSRYVIGTVGFEYHPFTKAYFFGETYFGQTENDANSPALAEYPRANYVGMYLGTHGQFTERLSGTVKAGFEHRYYSDGGDPLDAPVVEMSLDARIREKTRLLAGYSRYQYESIQRVRSSYVSDYLFFNWLQQIGGDGRLNTNFRVAYQLSDFEEGRNTSKRNDRLLQASLTISYDIKLWMRAFGSYSFEHFNSDGEGVENFDVNRVTLGLQIGY